MHWTIWLLAGLLVACNGDDSSLERLADPTHDRVKQRAADRARDDADKMAAEARAKVDLLAKDLAALDQRVGSAAEGVAAATTDAERAQAKAALDKLRREKTEMESRIATAKAEAARAERRRGVSISKECLDNPLAKGCS
ncbi:MAG: hypothetical protein ABI867_43325 [Kofleriaceae bacterium]